MMTRSIFPFRPTLLAAVAVLGMSSVCPGAGWAQTPSAPVAMQLTGVDPVSAAVAEASRRFGVPEPWIWSVMRVESRGNARAASRAGAMGLMQVMPGTYAELRARYGLGHDPFDVRDNVLAGTAYLRDMHDRYGAEGMLAAYNAGPARWEAYVRAGRRLPAETVGYLARLAPAVGVVIPSVPSALQPLGIVETHRPSLFVQVGGRSAAIEVRTNTGVSAQTSIVGALPIKQLDSVFVQRSSPGLTVSSSDLSVSDQAVEEPRAARANPLFVPAHSDPDRS